MRDLMRSHELTHTQIGELVISDLCSSDRLCDSPSESAAALNSLTLMIFDFCHRLERLYVSDTISSLEFFRAASSTQYKSTWPRLRELYIRDVSSCDCDLNAQNNTITCKLVQDLAPVITGSLDCMSKIEGLGVFSHCSSNEKMSRLELTVFRGSESILELIHFELTQKQVAEWEYAVERLGGGPMIVRTVSLPKYFRDTKSCSSDEF